ncbi:MAG: hypothetical protein Q8O90_06660 [Elusimicrobiota bacterium]|nr:hypothetical protein [Elusimicrobiota bacterium]
MPKVPVVPADVWKDLYAAAGRFYERKPWEYFDDTTLIGVRNPEDGQTGYGCILGAPARRWPPPPVAAALAPEPAAAG